MKKAFSLLVAGTMALSLCGTVYASTPAAAPETAETTEAAETEVTEAAPRTQYETLIVDEVEMTPIEVFESSVTVYDNIVSFAGDMQMNIAMTVPELDMSLDMSAEAMIAQYQNEDGSIDYISTDNVEMFGTTQQSLTAYTDGFMYSSDGTANTKQEMTWEEFADLAGIPVTGEKFMDGSFTFTEEDKEKTSQVIKEQWFEVLDEEPAEGSTEAPVIMYLLLDMTKASETAFGAMAGAFEGMDTGMESLSEILLQVGLDEELNFMWMGFDFEMDPSLISTEELNMDMEAFVTFVVAADELESAIVFPDFSEYTLAE